MHRALAARGGRRSRGVGGSQSLAESSDRAQARRRRIAQREGRCSACSALPSGRAPSESTPTRMLRVRLSPAARAYWDARLPVIGARRAERGRDGAIHSRRGGGARDCSCIRARASSAMLALRVDRGAARALRARMEHSAMARVLSSSAESRRVSQGVRSRVLRPSRAAELRGALPRARRAYADAVECAGQLLPASHADGHVCPERAGRRAAVSQRAGRACDGRCPAMH